MPSGSAASPSTTKPGVSKWVRTGPAGRDAASTSIVDLLEARELIEPHIAAAAARNATDAQLADLV